MISAEIQSLAPTKIVEMFILDATNLGPIPLFRFHDGTNEFSESVVWQGAEYRPMPIEVDGFESSTKGTLPRPKLRIANAFGLISAELMATGDLVGAKLTRKQTFVRYLDAVNFEQGNPYANPSQSILDQTWFVDKKVSENRYFVEWELASALDVQGVMLPFRQVIQNSCPWKYRGTECGYTSGIYYDKDNKLTTAENDFCNKQFSACKIRFEGIGKPLNFGGFPGAVRGD